jgi:GDPmannose 4,6-dehydratase
VINPKFFRPAEVDYLKGNPAEAETVLKWTRDVSFDDLARRMVESDIQNIRNE